MPATDYLDFELEITRTADGYRARVQHSPAGEPEAPFAMPFSDLEVENMLLRMAQFRRGLRRVDAPDVQLSKEFGGRLFHALFTESIYHAFQVSRERAAQQGVGVRLRLRLAGAPELATLPWECLYDPAENRFLALSTETPIVRRLPIPTELPPLPVSLPIRILVLIASPTGLPALQADQEWANLTQALADLQQQGRVVLERLAPPTLSALQRALRRGDYHVFHFVGHGGFDPGTQAGLLYLEDEAGQADAVAGDRLGTLLHDERNLRLAVLNACEGGRTARDDPFAGVAQSLIQQDIPAVVAMQFAVSDEAAVCGAHEFYLALADGLPVDAALTEARKAIYGKGMGTEWATPVLYMTAPNGRIFDIAQVTPGKVESAPPVVPPAPPTEQPPVKPTRPAETGPQELPKRSPRVIAIAAAAVLGAILLATALATRGFGVIGGVTTPTSTVTPTQGATEIPIVVMDSYTTDPSPVVARQPFTLTIRFCNLSKIRAISVLANFMDETISPVGTGRMFVVGDMEAGGCIDMAKRYVVGAVEGEVRHAFEISIKYADAKGTSFAAADNVNLEIVSPTAAPTITHTVTPTVTATSTATSTKPPTPTVRIVGTIRPILTPRPVITTRPSSTPTPDSAPRFGTIDFCLAIDNSNRCINPTKNLPAKTKKFYISFEYRNIPLGSRFDRIWYYNNKVFKKNQDTWDSDWNSPTGVEFTFFEYTQGLAAGVYRVELWIAGKLLQSGEVTIGG